VRVGGARVHEVQAVVLDVDLEVREPAARLSPGAPLALEYNTHLFISRSAARQSNASHRARMFVAHARSRPYVQPVPPGVSAAGRRASASMRWRRATSASGMAIVKGVGVCVDMARWSGIVRSGRVHYLKDNDRGEAIRAGSLFAQTDMP
jgi:hypothetical protein